MIAISLGSGLSSFVDAFEVLEEYDYSSILDINHLPVEGHERKVYRCKHDGYEFIVLSGKLHYYEGFDVDFLTSFYANIINKYAISIMIHTSASGALSGRINIGEWCQVNRITAIPPTMAKVRQLATSESYHGLGIQSVQYAYQQGPSLGTMAEYKMLHYLGAELVGMSMYPEALAIHAEVKNYFFSLPVCQYYPFKNAEEPTHDEVVLIASQGVEKLQLFTKTIIENHYGR